MDELEVVAKIDDLVNNTEPTIAAQIMASIKVAQDYQKKAKKIYEILTSGKLVKPKMSTRKTIDVSENTATVSGWESLNLKWKKAIAEQLNLSLEQDEGKVKEYYQAQETEFAQYGYQTRVWELDPEDEPGKHYRSHAEKQVSAIKPSSAIGISRAMCEEDCYPYFHALAQIRKQNLVVVDSEGVWVFYKNGQVKIAYYNK